MNSAHAPYPRLRKRGRVSVHVRSARASRVLRSGEGGRFSLELSDDSLDTLADLIAERVSARVLDRLEERESVNRWLTTKEAAEHIGRSVAAVHRLTAERSIPFEQDGAGAKCWFQRSELDAWMRSES